MKTKDTNSAGILFDQMVAAIDSNLSEYTIKCVHFIWRPFFSALGCQCIKRYHDFCGGEL